MLRIPNKTLDDNYLLEDFQHDFNYLLDFIKSVDASVSGGGAALNAKDYGITGYDSDDDTDKIQEFINLTGILYFPKGTYNLSKIITIKSNTTIMAHPDALFIRKQSSTMFQTEHTETTLNYNGGSNISFLGGKYKHNGNTSGSNVFSLFHAKDVTFNGVTILDTVKAHSLDIIGCKNVRVLNCNFRGHIIDTSNTYREMIQIDSAHAKGYPIYSDTSLAVYDGTPCEDILIQNCIFEKSDSNEAPACAIGQHTQIAQKSRHKNIVIKNNILNGVVASSGDYGAGIRLMQMEDVIVADNIIKGFRRGIYADLSATVAGLDGSTVIDGSSTVLTSSHEKTYFVGCKNVNISDNTIIPATYNETRPGIWCNISDSVKNASTTNVPKHRTVKITGNTIYLPCSLSSIKSYGIDIETIDDAYVADNMIIATGHANNYGVGIQEYSTNVTIGDNHYNNIAKDNKIINAKPPGCSNVRIKGKTKLWSGNASTTNTTITLSKSIDDYDEILLEIYYLNTCYHTVDFSTTTTQSFREFNVSDSTTASEVTFFEMRFKRVNATTIQILGNKTHLLSSGKFTLDDSGAYISAVYGIIR